MQNLTKVFAILQPATTVVTLPETVAGIAYAHLASTGPTTTSLGVFACLQPTLGPPTAGLAPGYIQFMGSPTNPLATAAIAVAPLVANSLLIVTAYPVGSIGASM